jgi:hypothetical protein
MNEKPTVKLRILPSCGVAASFRCSNTGVYIPLLNFAAPCLKPNFSFSRELL